jgi:type IV secretory pathway VirD2 relaxase
MARTVKLNIYEKPPNNSRVDGKALVKTLVKRMEMVTGYSFIWMAAFHNDTAHPHVHLLINGRDKNDRDISFSKLFIKQTIHEMTRQICTELIGRRKDTEIRESLLKSYQNNRFTPFDTLIKKYELPLKEDDDIYHTTIKAGNELLRRRLLHLTELGLAVLQEGTTDQFNLEKLWDDKLKATGRYNSYLKARSHLVTTLPSNLTLYNAGSGEISSA